MSGSQAKRNPVEELAEEFLERYRLGERPSLSEYIRRHPELAEEIRELFPALVMMEEVGAKSGQVPSDRPLSGARPFCERLGDYRILREVGRGGMGIVYEAEQESLGRHVALKVLPTQATAFSLNLQRFRREARSAARLHHTNIVPVYDVGDFQGIHYYAMQFIQGQGLDEVLNELRRLRGIRGDEKDASKDGPSAPTRGKVSFDPNLTGSLVHGLLTNQFSAGSPEGGNPQEIRASEKEQGVAVPTFPGVAAVNPEKSPRISSPLVNSTEEMDALCSHDSASKRSDLSAQSDYPFYRSVARIGLQVAEALAYAHGQKVLHRDIKPANLLLDLQGTVWVTDFGLAKEEGDDLTHTGDLVGTLRYMAPERFHGESDARSDVYSLGLTLYELLTLHHAFEETDRYRLIERVTHEEPPRPRKYDPRLPRDLETIVLKAIAKEPKLRYQTAAALAEDLRRFLTDRPIQARRTAVWEHAWRWCRRNPQMAGLSALVLFLVVVVGVGAPVAALLRSERDWALAAQERAEKAEGKVAFRSHLAHAAAYRHAGQGGQSFKSLEEVKKALRLVHELNLGPEALMEVRNEAIAALALPDVCITKEFGSFPPGSVWVELNEDFTLYVRTTDKGDCTIRRVEDDAEVAHLPELGEQAQAAFGAGGILAVRGYSSHRFQLWDLSGAEPVRRFEKDGIAHWCFRADGRLVALAHVDNSLSVYETASDKCIYRVTQPTGNTPMPMLHPTEPFVACFSYYHRGVPVYDLRSGKVVAAVATTWTGGSSACWSPDGHSLFVAECDGGIIQEYAFDVVAPALRLLRTIQGPRMDGAELTFNPAGDRFVRRAWDGVVVLFDAVSGQELFRTHSLPPTSESARLRFDRTGQRLAGARVGDRKDRIGLWSVAEGREYRSLVHPGSAEAQYDTYRRAIHPGGRLAAQALVEGVALFDLENGRELAQLPISPRWCSVSFEGTGNLLTNSFEGCFRWPVRPDSADPGRLLVGPPERLPLNPGSHEIAASHDGRVIGQCMWAGYGEHAFAGGWILHPNSPTPRRVDAGISMDQCSVSPDGRWVAFGGPSDAAGRPLIHVYDAATAQRVWQCPVQDGEICRFSHDGRWLLTDTDGGRSYAVGTWEPGPHLGPGKPWDVTSDLAVLGQTDGTYRLIELATGRELARLEDPKHHFAAAALTPDGTKLVVAAKNGLHVWDLHLIRAELAELGLDWDAPPFSTTSASRIAPLSIRVELNDTFRRAQAHLLDGQAQGHLRLKEYAKALAALQQAVRIDPGCAKAHNNLSWLLLAGPRELRDPAQALPSARMAVELEPNQAIYLNTLGVALYYTGQFAEAIPLLERSLREQNGQADAFDLFFLAMCHHRQGDTAKAKECHERGKEWFQEHRGKLSSSWVEDLTTFQAEADSVLAQPQNHGKK
jgi:serine/threonine protein kinase/WD40 repeat protein/Tfp pilus assembly protein PilF